MIDIIFKSSKLIFFSDNLSSINSLVPDPSFLKIKFSENKILISKILEEVLGYSFS